MRYFFSSGEIMYDQNKKELNEGIFEGLFLEYEEVNPDSKFYCTGKINNNEVKVGFKISSDGFQTIKSRHRFGILMQSDILHSEWGSYEIFEIK